MDFLDGRQCAAKIFESALTFSCSEREVMLYTQEIVASKERSQYFTHLGYRKGAEAVWLKDLVWLRAKCQLLWRRDYTNKPRRADRSFHTVQ